MRKFLFDGSDASWIFTTDDVFDHLWKYQFLFAYDLTVFNNIDSNIVIDESENIQIQSVDVTFYF